MTVFLRPNPSSVPVDYQKIMAMNGLITLPQRQLAIYTCKSGANIGPQGPPGIDHNSLYDTIIAAATDEYTPISVGAQAKTTYRCPYPLDLATGYIRMSLTNAPVGASFIVDLKMNGTSMFSTLLSIDAGELTSVTASVPAVLAITTIPDDAQFQCYVTQIGSTESGTGLKVAVTGIKTT